VHEWRIAADAEPAPESPELRPAMVNVREYAAQTVQELKILCTKPLAPFLPWSAFPEPSFRSGLTLHPFQTLHPASPTPFSESKSSTPTRKYDARRIRPVYV